MKPGSWADNEMLVSLLDQSGLAGEQFLKLQARLRALKHATNGGLTSVVVTSPLMGEGKTACAVNLAVALAHEPERRVLLLDCDLRKPRIGTYLAGIRGGGLLQVLEQGADMSEVAVTMPGGTLDVIALPLRGASNGHRPPALPIEKLKDLLGALRGKYEFIICDAPPVLPTADAAALVDICDGALMVIRAGMTPRPAATRALAAIDKKKLIGLLLNAVPEESMGKYYYKYYHDEEKKP